jgi:pyruvate dehydrogenase E2 component (dihydrolipoamide acetyltransferase)
MITREDVLRAKKAGTSEAAVSGGERLSRSQGAVARAVLKSWQEIPHLCVSAAVDMTACERIRQQRAIHGAAVSYDAFFLKAMAGAIRAIPWVAARLDGECVVRPEGVHMAVAVGVENDLYLPVIRDVNRKDLPALQGEIVALAAQARTRVFRAEQLTGGCMALSNLGMYPIESFDPIIFPEHSAILAVGAVQKKPVVLDDRIEIRSMCQVKLAVDHRLINGRTAAQFVCKVQEILEAGALDG